MKDFVRSFILVVTIMLIILGGKIKDYKPSRTNINNLDSIVELDISQLSKQDSEICLIRSEVVLNKDSFEPEKVINYYKNDSDSNFWLVERRSSNSSFVVKDIDKEVASRIFKNKSAINLQNLSDSLKKSIELAKEKKEVGLIYFTVLIERPDTLNVQKDIRNHVTLDFSEE